MADAEKGPTDGDPLARLKRFDRIRAHNLVIAYATISLAYILISDLLLIGTQENWTTLTLSLIKGFTFVAITSILIHYLIRRNDAKRLELQNRICDLNELMNQRQMVSQVLRLESIGRLAAGMAHNLNNTLAVIGGNVDAIDKKTEGSDISKNLRSIRSSVSRARSLSDTLLSFSEGGEPVKELTAIGDFVEDLATSMVKDSNAKLSLDLPKDLSTVLADKGQLRHAFENLLMNSLEALPGGGSIVITGRGVHLTPGEIADLGGGEYIRIKIQDSGPGVPEDVLERIFDPYFSTKGHNRGLGLTLAQSVIRRHGGVIVAESQPGQGAAFITYLPVHRYVPDQRLGDGGRKERSGRILWMDDEDGIREIGKELLEHLGYEAVTAAEGQEAIDLYQRDLGTRPFDAVILDLLVPNGLGGAETMEKLMAIDPAVRAVVCSGYSNDPIMANHLEHGFMAVLPKPFNIANLKSVLATVTQ
ncbi:MAG: ATP-binding protein [Methanomassiliicoccales archaeon]